MAHAIYLLRLEHGNAASLLDALEEQARALTAGEPADRELIRLTLEYFHAYPDACHHPKEELVLRHLRARRPRVAAAFDNLESEHATLTARTSELLEGLGRSGAGGDRDLGASLIHFVTHYRQHIDEEERDFFPAALAGLETSDWEEIAFDLFDRVDPLFDHVLEDRYTALREAIRARAGADHRARAEREEAAWLANLSGSRAFNARMRALGSDLVLVESADGSHTIEQGGVVRARIPACSAARAAWCAHYFSKGVDSELHARPETPGE